MSDKLRKPDVRPKNPCFSSGPCAKRPGWAPSVLKEVLGGRSHRSIPGKAKLKAVIDRSKDILGVPCNYRVGIVPASDTGAIEMSLWSMLGARGVDIFSWESFGAGWVGDITKQLKLEDIRVFEAGYGALPDLSQWDPARDIVFTWNGTTSGVRVPDGDWIPSDRRGLTICDATSAVFAMELPWSKLDVVTWSWQKVMGGEAAHGMIALSPKAIERLETYVPPWPLPKIFRMTKGDKLNEGIFRGETINTPSMVCVEDALDSLSWATGLGGRAALIARSQANLSVITDWVERTKWVGFLAENPEERSSTSVCLKIVDPWFEALEQEIQFSVPKKIDKLLEQNGAAFDINGYRDAPPGLRIWAGSTVETADIEALMPWLDWAYLSVKAEFT
ncbi:MAG: Phosphoserine aminotransferase [Alphaproteobacteria bacterium MarineAlpha11_Bin1]|nr:MAG: Phosphoserine aminotransferase [Alphaproteobacteria bacterium MarineAlpha11_Bin1]|tara:strand:- start:9498 stop:10667 length:1170 start_codon:yes stop_codon:yes gene_type:complete